MFVFRNKSRITSIIISVIIVATVDALLMIGTSSLVTTRSRYYENLSSKTTDIKTKIVNLEKSIVLLPSEEKVLKMSDLYVEIGDYEKAEKHLAGANTLHTLNKLGNISLLKGNPQEALEYFTRARRMKENRVSLEGLYDAFMMKGESKEAYESAQSLSKYSAVGAGCRKIYAQLYEEPKKAFDRAETTNCNIYNLNDFISAHNENQSPQFLKLSAINSYHQAGLSELAQKDILLLLKENDGYRDTHILAYEIFNSAGNAVSAEKHKLEALAIDPLAFED